MLAYLQRHWRPPSQLVDTVGWGRFYLCVGLFQPLLALSVGARFGLGSWLGRLVGFAELGLASDGWLTPLGAGLCYNAPGHSSYMLFRVITLEQQRRRRTLEC